MSYYIPSIYNIVIYYYMIFVLFYFFSPARWVFILSMLFTFRLPCWPTVRLNFTLHSFSDLIWSHFRMNVPSNLYCPLICSFFPIFSWTIERYRIAIQKKNLNLYTFDFRSKCVYVGNCANGHNDEYWMCLWKINNLTIYSYHSVKVHTMNSIDMDVE